MGDNHISNNIETPLREDAFELDNEIKIELIQKHFKEIMQVLGLDLTDESLKDTPKRVAKMYVNETFAGLNPKNQPKATLFENNYQYKEMLVEKNIGFYSTCEHHFVPIFGKAHVAYISNGNVIGLSKLNRIVDFFAKRPQVQERMCIQIANHLKEVLKTEDVAVIMEAKHLCVASRGIKDDSSTTVTSSYHGKFNDCNTKSELMTLIENDLK